MPGTAERNPFVSLALLHVVTVLYVLAWMLIARLHGYPIATLYTDPIAAVELALHSVQQHPEEGIHALARIQLPPYTGVLQQTAGFAWAAALALALVVRRDFRIALLSLLLLVETSFQISERFPGGEALPVLYFALLAGAIWRSVAQGRHLQALPALACAACWLLLRSTADFLLVGETASLAESFAALQAALLLAFAAAQRGVRS